MAIEKKYISDVEAILSHRYDNGANAGCERLDFFIYLI